MNLSLGIVGLPNVGKSTLFNALLKKQAALAANYPFATIDPNVGVVDVPDTRLEILTTLTKEEFQPKYTHKDIPEKITPSVIKFHDIAGLVKGAHKGEGLGNQFLSHIREVNAIVHVVRGFEDTEILRSGSEDVLTDVSTINTELILADLQVLEKRLPFLEKESKRGSKDVVQKYNVVKQIFDALNDGKLAIELTLSSEDLLLVKEFNLLTLKPKIYLVNISEQDFYAKKVFDYNLPNCVYLCAKMEFELSMLSSEDRILYLQELGMDQSGLDALIKLSFDVLGLQTFFTAGPKEVRSWTLKKGSKAPQAAGEIHTDFERGFISAEIINYDEFVEYKTLKNAKDAGKVRIEGKEYLMKDGDIVEFRFNV